jgi:hypothetical protein
MKTWTHSLVLACLALCSCALAFSAGERRAPAPAKFGDIENSPSGEEQAQMSQAPPGSPTFGLSFVAGGKPMDAGALPKPPLPIVLPL